MEKITLLNLVFAEYEKRIFTISTRFYSFINEFISPVIDLVNIGVFIASLLLKQKIYLNSLILNVMDVFILKTD